MIPTIPGNPFTKLKTNELICTLQILDATVEIYAAPALGINCGVFLLESADKKVGLQGGIDMNIPMFRILENINKAYLELVADQMKQTQTYDGTRTDH